MGHVVQVNGDYSIKSTPTDPVNAGRILLDPGASGFVTITGTLLVEGETLSVEAEDLNIKDNVIILNYYGDDRSNVPAGVVAIPDPVAGIQIDRGTLSPAVFLFDEVTDSWILGEGDPSSGQLDYSKGSLFVRRIKTTPDTDNGNLSLECFNVNRGVVDVGDNTTNYHLRVNKDNDIPNKRYVDLAIQNSPSFQIVRGTTRVISFDINDPIEDPSSFFPIASGAIAKQPPQSEIAVIVNDKRVINITEREFQMRGLAIVPGTPLGADIASQPQTSSITINATSENSNLILETNGSGKVQITYALQFDPTTINNVPSANNLLAPNTRVVYNGPIGGGTSGVYVVNNDATNNYRDELVLRNRALLFSMIF